MTALASGRPVLAGQRIWLPAVAVVALLALWEASVRGGLLPLRYAPPPTVILAELGLALGERAVWAQLGATLAAWAASLAIAVAIGIPVGTGLGLSRPASAFFRPIIDFLRPIPSIAMIPILVLVIGTGTSTEILLAVYAALWQLLISAMAAARAVDPVAMDTARSFGLSRAARARHLLLPSMLPHLLTGLRVASATALILCITSELLIGSPGLGAGLGAARAVGDLPRMYAFIVLIGLLGLGLTTALQALGARTLFWHESQRGRS